MYTIKVLRDAEFDRLPYKHVKESFGLADQSTETAYVRQTGIKPLDTFVMEHELEELIAKVSPHEEDGIRYKKARDIMGIVGPVLLGLVTGGLGLPAWMGAAGGALGGGIHGYQSGGGQGALTGALGGGLSGYGGATAGAGAVAGGTAAGPGFLSKAGGIIGGAGRGLMGMAPAGGAGNATTLPSTQLTGSRLAGSFGAPGQAGSLAFQAGGGGASSLAMPGASPLGSGLMGAGQTSLTIPERLKNLIPSPQLSGRSLAGSMGDTMLGPGKGVSPMGFTGSSSIVPPTQSTQDGGFLSKIGDFFKGAMGEGGSGFNMNRTLLGAGIGGIGQMMKPNIPFPDLAGGAGTQNFKNLLAAGPKGVEVSDELKSQLEDEIQGKYDQLTQRTQQKYKQLRPGSDYLNDSQYQDEIKELEADQQDEMKNAVANYQEQQYQTQLQGAQYFSQMDTYELMGQTGLDVQSAQEFQDWLRTIGGGLFQSGLGMF